MIKIETIPHNQQRYNTCGDWQFLGDDLIIRVSELNNKDFEFLVGLHELVEAFLCKEYGITQECVDDWDKTHADNPDPGSIPGCPYYREHLVATMIEQTIALQLGVDWNEYEEAIEAL